MHFTGTKSSPYILLLLKHKNCLARILFLQRILTEKIKLNHYDETTKRTHDSQIVRAKENLKLSHGGPSQRKASGINPRLKALRLDRH